MLRYFGLITIYLKWEFNSKIEANPIALSLLFLASLEIPKLKTLVIAFPSSKNSKSGISCSRQRHLRDIFLRTKAVKQGIISGLTD